MSGIYWFRKALRLHDNFGLDQVSKCEKHLCLFILDPHFVKTGRVGVRRWAFLIDTLNDLHKQLAARQSRLIVLRGNPEEIFKLLFDQEPDCQLYFEKDYEPYAVKRDAAIVESSPKGHVHSNHGHVLYPPEKVLNGSKTKVPMKYDSFLKLVAKMTVPPCIDAPKSFNGLADSILDKLAQYSGPNENFDVFSMKELGLKDDFKGFTQLRGGETEALARMTRYLKDEGKETSPTAFDPPSTTVLSPYLKFGSLSVRKFYHALRDIEKRYSGHTIPPTSLVGQILWRDFFYCVGSATPNFHKMQGNDICVQNEWSCIQAGETNDFLDAWKNAKTGFPWIDAIMTQLRLEGWIHHLARHATACFLTRGDLYVSWERGFEVFDELLLDADHFVNAGNWMWLSASAFFHQYFRVYSPVAFGKKYDKKGAYVRRYLPALKNVPDSCIYEPWKMSAAQQKAAGCILGRDYPHPIVDHDEAKGECMAKMKEAYAIRRGDAPDKPSAKRVKHE